MKAIKTFLTILTLFCFFTSYSQNNDAVRLQNEITILERKIQELEKNKAEYAQIRKLKIQLEDKRNLLSEYYKMREGIDIPIEDGLKYLLLTKEKSKKYSENDKLNNEYFISSINGRIIRLNNVRINDVQIFENGLIIKIRNSLNIVNNGENSFTSGKKYLSFKISFPTDYSYYDMILIYKDDALKLLDYEKTLIPFTKKPKIENETYYLKYIPTESTLDFGFTHRFDPEEVLEFEGLLNYNNGKWVLKDWVCNKKKLNLHELIVKSILEIHPDYLIDYVVFCTGRTRQGGRSGSEKIKLK